MGNSSSGEFDGKEESLRFGELEYSQEEMQELLGKFGEYLVLREEENSSLESKRRFRWVIDEAPQKNSGFGLSFVIEDYLEVARMALEVSRPISECRYALVPKRINEEEFWKTIIFIFIQFVRGIDKKKLHSQGKELDDSSGEAKQSKPLSFMEEDGEDEFVPHQTLLKMNLCYVYKLPRMYSSTGYFADQWDLPNPICVGSLYINSNMKDEMNIRIFESKSGELFVESPPIPVKDIVTGPKQLEYYLQRVNDSSRYFVFRVEDKATRRKALLGLGFHERMHSFNFQATIDDYIQQVRRQCIPSSDEHSSYSKLIREPNEEFQSRESLDQRIHKEEVDDVDWGEFKAASSD